MKYLYLWLIGALLFFGSCKKTISPTQAENTAASLNSFIKGISITNIDVYNNNTIVYGGTSLQIAGNGMVTIYSNGGSATFNLGLLKEYQLVGNALDLYF
jgi:hypothetical protein